MYECSADELLKKAQVDKTAVEIVGEDLRNMMQTQQNEYYAMTRELEKQFLELQNAKTAEEVLIAKANIGFIWAQTASESARSKVLKKQSDEITEEIALIQKQIKGQKITNEILQHEEAIQAAAEKYAEAGEIIGLITSGASAFRDVGFGVGSWKTGLGGLFDRRKPIGYK